MVISLNSNLWTFANEMQINCDHESSRAQLAFMESSLEYARQHHLGVVLQQHHPVGYDTWHLDSHFLDLQVEEKYLQMLLEFKDTIVFNSASHTHMFETRANWTQNRDGADSAI